ncbi:MAG: AzlD domain-containing protein [Campylobacteraceae bacterium]|nr:AzlD domain-containing protein [Campylobacteraceae bacterium]
MDSFTLSALAIIFLVALGTYSLRVSGILLSSKLSKNKNIELFLDYLPSTLLLALVFPSILKEGVAGIIASLLIVLIMYKTNNVLISMCASILFVALFRNYMT